MKKALLCGLSAAMLLALVLVACNKPQADQPTEPDPSPTPSAVQTQPEEANEPVNQVEQMSINTQQEADTRREATLMDLLELFQTVYDCRADWISLGEGEEVLELLELEEVNFQVEANPDVIYPADMQNRYLEWKAIYYGTTELVSAEEQQTTNISGSSTTTTTTTTTTTQTSSVDQSKLDTGFEADIDPETGDIYYWNPNTTGDLGTDVTGGKSPMDFMGMTEQDKIDQEYISEHGYLDMSKVGFGE